MAKLTMKVCVYLFLCVCDPDGKIDYEGVCVCVCLFVCVCC